MPLQGQHLLDDLKDTQLCFICAHGRPTTAPMVDLQLLRNATDARRNVRLLAHGIEHPCNGQQHAEGLTSLKRKLQRAVA